MYLEDVSNSAEVEQSQEQSNECEDFAACANVAGAQAQTAASTVANTLSILEDVTNSAEVEQSQEQSNECQDLAACANVAGAQAQTAAATVANTLIFLKMLLTAPK